MAAGFALAAGLIKGFTQNIGREAARREKDDARLDKLEEMLFASMLKPVDERPGADAINAIQDTLKGARSVQAERKDINIFGTPGKRIDLDLMKTANLLNEVQGGTLNFGGYKMPVSKLYGTKALLNKPFEQGQEWLRAVNVHLNDPLKKVMFFQHLKGNEQAMNMFKNEYARHSKLFLNGYTNTFSKQGDANKAYTTVLDNFSNFKDVDSFVGNTQPSPIDVVVNHKLLMNQAPTKGEIYFKAKNNAGIDVLSTYKFTGPNADKDYQAISNIAKRLNYKRPSDFIFDFQNKLPELRLAQGENPSEIYSYIFNAIELEKMNFSGMTRSQQNTNDIARFLVDKYGDNRYKMALTVMPLVGTVDNYSKFMKMNGNIVPGLPRVEEIEKIFNLGKNGAVKIKQNYQDAIAVQRDLTSLINLRRTLPTGQGIVQNVGSVLTSIFGEGGQIDQIGNMLRGTAGGEDLDVYRATTAVKNFLARYGTEYATDQEKLGRIDSLVISLAARMARAVDPSGRLSNQDFEVQLQRLGNSGLFTNIPRQLAALQETLGDFTNRVNRLKVINDIIDGRGTQGIQYSLTDTERRLLYADKQISSIMSVASPDIISNIEKRTLNYSTAREDGRVATAPNYLGPNGEEVEVIFDRNQNQVMGQFFINGRRVDRGQARFVRPSQRQLFAGTETEADPTKRGPSTQTFVGDDPETEAVSDELRDQIRRDPTLGVEAKPTPRANVQQQTQTGQYPPDSKVIRPLGNGQFRIELPSGEQRTVKRNNDGSYSDITVGS